MLFRSRGVATLLMDEVLAFAARARVEEIYLEVRVSNQPARVFYAGRGGRAAGRRTRDSLDGAAARGLGRDMRRAAS